MPAAVESMMYNRERGLPWHGLGQGVDGVATAEEAIKAAGLDWEVELRDVFTMDKAGKNKRVTGNFAVTRTSDDTVFGIVKSRYAPFQNREAFQFTDNLVDSGEAKYDTAGSLRGGRVVFMSMSVPDSIMVGGEDPHDMYILLRTSHDGTTAIGVYVTMIRTVCMNTLTLATKEAQYRWSIPHVSTIHGKIAEARNTLELSFSYADEFNKMAEELMQKKITDDAAASILEQVFPTTAKVDEKIDGVMTCLRGSDRNGYHGSGWGLVNAITEFHQHWRDVQPEATFFNVLDGQVRKWRNEAAQMILA